MRSGGVSAEKEEPPVAQGPLAVYGSIAGPQLEVRGGSEQVAGLPCSDREPPGAGEGSRAGSWHQHCCRMGFRTPGH